MRRLLLITAILCLPTASADAATRWVVKGGGWGHALGMSQYGAYGQALAGRNYKRIVKHYYRSTELGEASGDVRILLLASVGSSTFRGAKRVDGKRVKPGKTYTVTRRGGRIVVRALGGKRVARSSGVLRVTGSKDMVTVGSKGTYRDAIEYRPGLSGGVTAVNHVELEHYLRGVVPRESPASWPIEALKAQAVAARSYALAAGADNGIYDHVDTPASQVYGGVGAEHPNTDRAVAETNGKVLRHDGKIIVAYFHSTSGGHTENNENIFSCSGCVALPYIRGVRDPWDKHSPYHRWRLSYSAPGLGAALGVGRLKRVKVQKRGVSGRIIYAKFRGSAGRVRLHGWDGIRGQLGLRDIPETFRRIRSRGSRSSAAAAGVGSRGVAREISGSFVPARKGARVKVERRSGAGWKRVGSGRIRRGGKYRVAVQRAGTYRVVSAGDRGAPVRVR